MPLENQKPIEESESMPLDTKPKLLKKPTMPHQKPTCPLQKPLPVLDKKPPHFDYSILGIQGECKCHLWPLDKPLPLEKQLPLDINGLDCTERKAWQY